MTILGLYVHMFGNFNPVWSEWSSCSVTCGQVGRSRTINCVYGGTFDPNNFTCKYRDRKCGVPSCYRECTYQIVIICWCNRHAFCMNNDYIMYNSKSHNTELTFQKAISTSSIEIIVYLNNLSAQYIPVSSQFSKSKISTLICRSQ